MRALLSSLMAACFMAASSMATTIMVVPIFEPLSLHGTDGDEIPSDTEAALQACVLSRPMAMTGGFPEVLIDAIRSQHPIPTNNPNYKVTEANLLVLCEIGISGEITDDGLLVRLDISRLSIPEEVDLTSRQIIRLATIAIRKTLEEYQGDQTQALDVELVIEGARERQQQLSELGSSFRIEPAPTR